MSKLTYEDKINIYLKRKNGISAVAVSREYNVNLRTIKFLVRLIDKHGFDILKRDKNKKYSKEFKINAINRVLKNNESNWSVSVDLGISRGLLSSWVKKYKEMDYNIVERKRGRSPTMKVTKKKKNETKDETIKRLEEENLYLKAELEYSKKLRAVVQARKNQQQKKK